ncbi:MAG: type I methionyl aminopeptidase [Candidatus Zambryskibacteria bacterium RIFCSPLOWO2_12_FULL_45_14]|uniref:Methionine aminopeptidase n=2 Tax=Candidatus Zambryskiibacteriota TaxID=1817925 RepID=A0A1G2UKI5_9BACT|nr:MAG: type I methionyl aminopeptidase [Candidatus Zambryskibacteria bacterium RIFCSPLOWO2_02_FULL_44_12b]OHB14562.1 MAG: type I methionyl aminopeptidase [Candidatus Zambryskibacteria bacterium RIFCSPLOWO2_12_FULL_45_14]
MSVELKTPEEIKILREGGKRHAEILSLLGKLVKPGISTLILEEEALRLIKEGRDKPAFLGYKPQGAGRKFPAALCVSINDEIVHGIPNEAERIISEGDIVSLDLGLLHKGLITDAAITVPAGRVDDESRKLIEVTRQALEQGISNAKPGKKTGDIGFAISETVRSSGFTLASGLTGHGVGYSVHEDPLVPNFGNKGSGEELVPGMVIAIEPMVNVGKPSIKTSSDGYTIKTRDGSRSAHFEHTVAITEKGNEVLTK